MPGGPAAKTASDPGPSSEGGPAVETCYHVVEHAGILENQGLIQDQPSRLADRAPPSKEQRGVDGVGHERWVRDKDEVMTEQMAGTSRMISSPPRE